MNYHGGSVTFTKVIVLVVIFIIVVWGGRYLLNPTQQTQPESRTGTASTTKNTSSTTKNNVLSDPQTFSSSSASSTEPSCQEKIRADLAAKKESYERGHILVTFTKDVDYGKAKDILAVYGLVVSNEVVSQESFALRHYITAAVTPGEEIAKVCLLRNDSHVRFAGLDLYFSLHE